MANTLQIEHWAIVWFCQWWFVRACTRNSDARRNKNTNNSITLNTHNVKIVRRDFYAFFNVLQSSVVVFVVHLLTRNVYAEIDCFHMYVVMIIVTEFPFFFFGVFSSRKWVCFQVCAWLFSALPLMFGDGATCFVNGSLQIGAQTSIATQHVTAKSMGMRAEMHVLFFSFSLSLGKSSIRASHDVIIVPKIVSHSINLFQLTCCKICWAHWRLPMIHSPMIWPIYER